MKQTKKNDLTGNCHYLILKLLHKRLIIDYHRFHCH